MPLYDLPAANVPAVCFVSTGDMSLSGQFFGQLVIGPPGSGKTTFCQKMQQLFQQLNRPAVIVNIDPANELLPFQPAIDISELISTDDVMDQMKLGPNGALIYSMEYLLKNWDWLVQKIRSLPAGELKSSSGSAIKMNPYLIIDCPGQIELYTHNQAFRDLIQKLTHQKTSGLDLRLVAVYLMDSLACNDAGKFVSCLTSSLSAMLHMELPHVNLLSKADLMPKNSRFGLGYYCEVMDLSYLVDDLIDDPFLQKYKSLTRALAETIENYSLVSFVPIAIDDNRTVIRALRVIDRANGFHLLDMETEEAIARIFRDYDSADFEYSKFGHMSEKLSELDPGESNEPTDQ